MPTALIVDDLSGDRVLAGGILGKIADVSVIYAADGKDALEQIELHVPDLVLTDLQMPQMNGLELVRAMQEEYPLIPAILMTATGSEDIAVQTLEQGAASYVAKKHLAADLQETVVRVLASSADERSQTRLINSNDRDDFCPGKRTRIAVGAGQPSAADHPAASRL